MKGKPLTIIKRAKAIRSMTVRELQAILKKMPKDATVAFRDHDQDQSELNSFIGAVNITDFREIQPNMWELKEEVVVLSS